MDILIRALITFVVVLLVLYLVNMLPTDGRTKRVARVIVIIIGLLALLSYICEYLKRLRKPCAASKAM